MPEANDRKPKRFVVMRTATPEYERLTDHARATGKMLPVDPAQYDKLGGGYTEDLQEAQVYGWKRRPILAKGEKLVPVTITFTEDTKS